MGNSLKTYTDTQRKVRTEPTPVNKRTPGRTDEVKTNSGGFAFKVSDQSRLERFLILGTDGGTYYVKESRHVKDNVSFLTNMATLDVRTLVDTIVDISDAGRAYKNSPAIFALAVALRTAEPEDKAYVEAAVNKVVRTGTHLFEFVDYINSLGGWNRSNRRAVANWYTEKDADSLAYQAVKYRQRNGWTHRDVFRKVHPKGVQRSVGDFILGKGEQTDVANPPAIINGFRKAQAAGNANEVLTVLDNYRTLPWEALPTDLLKDVRVWKKLFYNGQLNGQALFRNITRLAKAGAFTDMKFAADYAARMTDEAMLAKTRMHPLQILNALVVYTEGQQSRERDNYYNDSIYRGATRVNRVKTWSTESVIVAALNDAFYKSFKYAQPAGKRTLVAVDVSGSMTMWNAAGSDLSAAQAAAAIAMTIARTEPAHKIMGFSHDFVDLGISASDSLESAMKKVQRPFGATNISLPMEWATTNKVEVDTFVVVTDNELNRGIKPTQALTRYRKATGIDAKLAVLGTAATDFTVADPTDKGQMDFVGFDANVPKVLADFSAGRI